MQQMICQVKRHKPNDLSHQTRARVGGDSPLSPESSLLTAIWVTPISYARDTHPENFPEKQTPQKNRQKNLTDLGVMCYNGYIRRKHCTLDQNKKTKSDIISKP